MYRYLKKENVRDNGILIDSIIEVGFIIRNKKLNDIIIKKERLPNFSQEWTLLIDQGLMTNRTKFFHYQKKNNHNNSARSFLMIYHKM